MEKHSKKFLLIDGHGIAFRAFYALPALNAPDGTPTNAIVGFFNMLGKIWHEQQPDAIYAAFDMKGPTFRHEIFPEYKGTRKPTPEEFKVQVPLIEEALPLLGIHVMRRQSIEADDLLGSAATTFAAQGDETLILTSDKDIFQVLRNGVKILRPSKGVSRFEEYTAQSFLEEYGFTPEKVVDYLALMGDTADNIPGIPGVGKKTAARLLKQYSSIEGIVEHISDLTPSLRQKVKENYRLAIKNRRLTRLKCDEPLDEFLGHDISPNISGFKDFCDKLGIKKFVATFESIINGTSAAQHDESVNAVTSTQAQSETTTDNAPVHEQEKRVAPTAIIPLDTMLMAPRIAIDVSANITHGQRPTEETLKDTKVILTAPDGSWWQGTMADLTPKLSKFLKRKVVCLDAKMLCALMETPQVGELWDIKTAWYLLHPDLEAYDAKKELDLEFSPERTLQLLSVAKELEKKIAAQNLGKAMKEIDMPLIPVLVNMERNGIKLKRDEMMALSDELEKRIDTIATQIHEISGIEVNLNSPKQLGELLFEKLGLPPVKKTKTGYSTNVSVLEHLRDVYGERCKVPALLLEYRELNKMLSGFVEPLLSAADSNAIIHSTFEALTTGTGRLSSRDPNLQNLPAYSGWGKRLRECLVPSREGNCFISADYSQIELRVLAHISGDPQLIDIFKENRDIHTETASLIFGLPPQAITKELRRNAKTVSFGLIYGMSTFGLASRLDCDRSTASKIINAYFDALPNVKNYINTAKQQALKEGYTQTIYGRRRRIDEISTGKASTEHRARAAINSPIQGSAADITKIAMCKTVEYFTGRDVHMVLQVHDSIVCECPADKAEEYASELADVMENAVSLSVPLKTQTSIGPSLAEV